LARRAGARPTWREAREERCQPFSSVQDGRRCRGARADAGHSGGSRRNRPPLTAARRGGPACERAEEGAGGEIQCQRMRMRSPAASPSCGSQVYSGPAGQARDRAPGGDGIDCRECVRRRRARRARAIARRKRAESISVPAGRREPRRADAVSIRRVPAAGASGAASALDVGEGGAAADGFVADNASTPGHRSSARRKTLEARSPDVNPKHCRRV